MTTQFKNNQRKILWSILFAIALTGIILMFLDCYLRSDADITEREGARRVLGWHERFIFPFYFTFISNMFGLVVSFMRTFRLDANKKLMRRLEVFMAVNLTITLIVYWATLFPKTRPDTDLSWASNLFIHLLTPVLAVAVFVYQTRKNKETYAYKNIYVQSAWNLIFPFAWLAVAIAIYYGLASTVDYDVAKTKSGAIYFFLDFYKNSWTTAVIYVFGIGIAYYGFTLLSLWISNPKIKK